MKKIKYLIISLLVIIIIIVGILITLNNNSQKMELPQEMSTETPLDNSPYNAELQNVTDVSEFYTVRNCINTYLDLINTNNSKYYSKEENALIVSENQIKQNILDLLSKEYVEKNNITIKNIDKFIENINESLIYTPLNMKCKQEYEVAKYLVYGFTMSINNEYKSNFYIIVNIDRHNNTFSIEPLNEKYNSINDISVGNIQTEIEKNNNNVYVNQKVNAEYICNEYLIAYKRMALVNPSITYEYLDKEYREKRFGSLENFKKYLQEEKDSITNLHLNEYLTNYYKDYIEYACKDDYGKIYIFNVTSPMNYSIKLDTYTITTDKFKTEYEKGNNQTKVQMNINKFVLMLNNQDFDAAYSVLDEDFKKNNFKTKSEFEEYMKNKTYRYNNLEIKNYEESGNTYLVKAELTDLTNGKYVDESKGTGKSGYIYIWDFAMQLKEGTDFVMSFEI